MRLTMDLPGSLGVRRVDEAEGGAIALVEPIGHVFYAVSVLDVDVPAVRLCDIVRLGSAQIVTVHENRHGTSLCHRAVEYIARRSQSSSEAALTCASPLAFTDLLETTISARASACKDWERS